METICINNKQCEQSADAVYRRITWKNNDERHHALMKHLVRRIKMQPGAFPGSLGNRCFFLMLWASLKTCMGVPWFGYQITPVVVAPFMLYLLYKGVPGTPLHVDEVCGGMRSPLRLPRRHSRSVSRGDGMAGSVWWRTVFVSSKPWHTGTGAKQHCSAGISWFFFLGLLIYFLTDGGLLLDELKPDHSWECDNAEMS
jgi:hypothetical protein